jgi:hypothetical protein
MKLLKNFVALALLTISMHANAQTSPAKSGASAAQEPVSKTTKNTERADVGGGTGSTKGTGSAGRADVGGGTGGTKGTGSAGRADVGGGTGGTKGTGSAGRIVKKED